nr:MAG TPA: hypothetical protein [Caudoviricetes sp.]
MVFIVTLHPDNKYYWCSGISPTVLQRITPNKTVG